MINYYTNEKGSSASKNVTSTTEKSYCRISESQRYGVLIYWWYKTSQTHHWYYNFSRHM